MFYTGTYFSCSFHPLSAKTVLLNNDFTLVTTTPGFQQNFIPLLCSFISCLFVSRKTGFTPTI